MKVTAESDDGEIMALEHREYPVFGVQFHPESVMTPDGKKMIRKFYGGSEDMIKEAIIKLSKKEDLTYEMAESVMDEIMSGRSKSGTDVSLLDGTGHEGRNHR